MPTLFVSFLRQATLLIGLLMTGILTSQAQAPGNGGTTGGPPAPSAAAVPLDGGASSTSWGHQLSPTQVAPTP